MRLGRKGKIAFLSTLVGVVFLSTVSASIAWFDVRAELDLSESIIGGTSGSFFESGKGTSGDPYVISKPRHLYNLAWLQDIGYFADSGTVYFKLGADIDMSDYTALPPIGTETYPFVGNFNGQGHTVSNLVVSNDFDDYTRTPYVVDDITDIGSPQIVGMFGVVGSLSTPFTVSSTTNIIKDTGILNATIKSATSQTLVGIAAGYVNGKLDNVAVNNSNLYTKLNAQPLSYTTNVSDYALVGYATDDAKNSMKLRSDDADIPLIDNPNTDQGGDNWGGSIKMQEMYNYLNNLRNNQAVAYTYPTAETRYTDSQGNITTTVTATGQNSGYANSYYYRWTGHKVIEDDKEWASMTFTRRSSSNTFSSYNDTNFVYLYGGVTNQRGTTGANSRTTNATKTVTSQSYATSNFKISNGTNYLRLNNGSLANTTTATNTITNWTWANNRLRTSTQYNNNYYYLNVNNGNLATLTSNSTTNNNAPAWTYDETNHNLYCTVSSTKYYLDLNGTTWRVVPESTIYYTIRSGSNYLAHTGTGGTNYPTTVTSYNASDASIRWFRDGSNRFFADEALTMPIQGRNNTTQTDNNSRAYYGTNITNNNRLIYNGTGNLDSDSATGALKRTNGNQYLAYNATYANNSPWRMTTTNTTLTFERRSYTPEHKHQIFIGSAPSTSSEDTYYDTYPTYFPLTREKDENGNYTGSGKPDAKNTGYVISGANLRSTDTAQGPYGDIRVSSYGLTSSLSTALNSASSYSDAQLEVLTRTCVRGDDGGYTDSGWTRISDTYNASNSSVSTTYTQNNSSFKNKKDYKTALRFSKYKSSRTQLGSTLSGGNGNIYGLHFMNAAISTSHLISAPNVIVLDGQTLDENNNAIGTYYSGYQLPEDAIDFNLKDQGFINFFAGSYFSNNNSFFSLNVITRNPTTHAITGIQRIRSIYAPASGEPSATNPYIYSYSTTKPTGAGDLVFDTAWIESPTMVTNSVYYFEIPVNAGEYALGSVSGGTGAYLMYLDIGAGIDNFKDITITEHISTTIKAADYPLGIDFRSFSSNGSWTAVVGGDTATIAIANGVATETFAFVYTETTNNNVTNKAVVVSTAGNAPPVSASYAAEGVTVNKTAAGSTSTLAFDPAVLCTIEMTRTTLESFNVFTSAVTRSVTEEYTVTGGESGMKFQLAKPVVSTGYTISDAITYTVTSGNPATVDSDGLVTRTGVGVVTVTMVYSEIMTGVETWDLTNTPVADDTEDTIFQFHFRDYTNPNAVVRYVYDGLTHTYYLYVTSSKATILYIDALPLSGYTVVINDGTNTTTLTSASTSVTSVNIAATA